MFPLILFQFNEDDKKFSEAASHKERDRFLLISVRRGLGYFHEFPVLSMATSVFLESFYKHDIRKCDQDEHQELSRFKSLPCLL